MSKYQIDQSQARKEELEGHQQSFQQDTQYVHSRASIQGSKILDNNNLEKNEIKKDEKDIQDLIDGSTIDQNQNNGYSQSKLNEQAAIEHNQKGSQQKLQSDDHNSNQNQNNETQIHQSLNLQQNQFQETQNSSINENKQNQQASQQNEEQQENQNYQQDEQQNEELQQNQSSLSNDYNQNEQVQGQYYNLEKQQQEDDQLVNEDDLYDNNKQDENNNKKSEPQRSNQNQDFGNISEIQEKKNQSENNDETAQAEDFSSILHNPNKKQEEEQNDRKLSQQDNQSQKNSTIQYKSKGKKSPKQSRRKSSDGVTDSIEEQDKFMTSSMRGSSASGSPQNHRSSLIAANEKLKKIEDAQKKKKDLEDELRQIQGEIAQMNHEEEKKKKKEKMFIKHEQIAEDKDAQENAVNLIKKLNLARQEKELKMEKAREKFNQLLLEDVKESHERQVRLKEKLQNQKKERIQQKLDQMRLRSEERKLISKQQNVVISEVKRGAQQNDPDERYKQEVELPELEKRKKELAEKRKLYKPIDMDEIRDHAKKHDEEIKLRKLQAKTNILVEVNSLEDINMKFPKTASLNKVLEDDKLYKMKDVLEMQKKKDQIQRRQEYAKLVKEVHVPRIKPRPNLDFYYGADNNQILNDIESNHNLQKQSSAKNNVLVKTPNETRDNQPKSIKTVRNTEGDKFSSNNNLSPRNDLNNKNNNVRSLGKLSKKDKSINEDQINKDLKEQNNNQQNQKQFDDNVENNIVENNKASHLATAKTTQTGNSAQKSFKQKTFKPATIEEPPKPIEKRYQSDYIQELRKQREEQERKLGKKSKLEDWEKYKHDPNLSSNQKYNYILQSANRLEHNAKLKELSSQNNNNLDAKEQANNLYIDSIKAKLALLDNMSK